MSQTALREPDDDRFDDGAAPVQIELADDALKLGGFAVGKFDGFDDSRAAALLAAAYGEGLRPQTLGYLKGVRFTCCA
jgi:hypothetical protein